jgi:Leucine-rich repeat (LRR) protein
MVNLKTLHSSRCGLQRLSDLAPLDKLTQLYLDKNDLEIDVIMSMPVTLQKLDLSMNHFSAFPPVLTTLVNLTELNMSGNRIEALVGVGGLVSLINLVLDDNSIYEIPEEAANLVKLRQISLKNNRISKRAVTRDGQSIPASFLIRTSVDTIDLSGNPGLVKADVMGFEGVDAFLDRRKKAKDRAFQGGAMTDYKLFGLD